METVTRDKPHPGELPSGEEFGAPEARPRAKRSEVIEAISRVAGLALDGLELALSHCECE